VKIFYNNISSLQFLYRGIIVAYIETPKTQFL